MNLFRELQRRNVFRVAIGYIVSCWFLLQVADLSLDLIGAPGWVLRAVALICALGFPVAVFFSWAYEVTPEGIKRESEVDRSQSITHVTGRKLNRAIVAVLVIALAYFVWESRFSSTQSGVETSLENPDATVSTPAVPDIPAGSEAPALPPKESDDPYAAPAPLGSIAVLPFVNMSDDPGNEYFSDGISEEILNVLAKVRELKVAGRTSSFAFKGKNQDLRGIGRALGVRHVLEGSVRKAGNQVRITAQLIHVEDGFHLWSETYDRELDDVFAIQDEIAASILVKFQASLAGLDLDTVNESRRTNTEVFDLYLQARQGLYSRKRTEIESAVQALERTIELDPTYAPALAQRGIAELLLSERNYGDRPFTETGPAGRRYLEEALQIDPGLAEAWAGMGLYYLDSPEAGARQQAIASLEKALSINPSLIDASNWLQLAYSMVGDMSRSLASLERMIDKDPLYPPGVVNAVGLYCGFGMEDKAWALLNRVKPFMPEDPAILTAEALAWIASGKPSRALPLLEQLLGMNAGDFSVRNLFTMGLMQTGQYARILEQGLAWGKAQTLIYMGRREEALDLAREELEKGDPRHMIRLLGVTGQHRALVDFVESRWADLDAFEAIDSGSEMGHGSMLFIAGAYRSLADERSFEEAMRRVRAVHDRIIDSGTQLILFDIFEARYYALAGDRERAVNLVARAAVGKFLLWFWPMDEMWPELEVLVGDPTFENAQNRAFDRSNSERAALGLEPIN